MSEHVNTPLSQRRVGTAAVLPIQDVTATMPIERFRGGGIETLAATSPGLAAPSSYAAFLVRRGAEAVLVDTGLGSEAPEKFSRLPHVLERAGLAAGDIGAVLLTHCHMDHVGGLVKNDSAAFPNATLFLSEPERDFWTSDAHMAQFPERRAGFLFVRRVLELYTGRVHTFRFDETVLPGIRALDAVGHTAGHAAFLLESEGESLLFGADIVHAALWQFPNPDIYATFDLDKDKGIASRRRLLSLAADAALPLAGAHLPFPCIGMVRRSGDGFTFVPDASDTGG
ncbi:MAG: MBL fold metallo-hydrolase [Methylobacteriaceae bacterium]|jgi:glyoxylase-like metal-dependent hydrolase (beta-lactamase superfamily II)|nr:MBL fold metallo-hydrolase [Methylobacteriaceae bacterium]